MKTETTESAKMKVFPKGQVVIPASLRKKYKIDIGDHIDVISGPDGILLKPAEKKEKKTSLTASLFGIFYKHSLKKEDINRSDISIATEDGFTEGWKE
jgi:AbrB family looped-hinge helix DNA binding protein